MEQGKFREILSKNLVYYRKLNNLTQVELAQKLNYSDKSVSKWERGDGVPDLYVVSTIAKIYGITVDDLLSEHPPKHPMPFKRKIILIPAMAVGIVWLVASILSFLLKTIFPSAPIGWQVYLYAVPVSCIVAVVFACIWWSLLAQVIAISALIWSVAVSVDVSLAFQNTSLIYIVAMVLQILEIMWYFLKRKPRRPKAQGKIQGSKAHEGRYAVSEDAAGEDVAYADAEDTEKADK